VVTDEESSGDSDYSGDEGRKKKLAQAAAANATAKAPAGVPVPIKKPVAPVKPKAP
jgi:hypothetical protein